MSDPNAMPVAGEVVTQPVAVYWTQTPGQRVFVGTEYAEAKPTGGFLFFTPTGRHYAHPLAVADTMQVEGFMVVRDVRLIRKLDAICEGGNVPFERHPNPTLIEDMPEVGVSAPAP